MPIKSTPIKILITTLLLVIYLVWLTDTPVYAQQNSIVTENQQAGTSSWQMNQAADDINMQIKGFASLTSVNKGDEIDLYVHVNPVQSFTINVYRMGWYDGEGGRLMRTIGPLNGVRQPNPVLDRTTGMVTAPWSRSHRLQIPTNWTSGVYLAKLTNANGYNNYVIFIVRDDNNSADFLYQHAITTSQAYNNFPDNGVLNKSLYSYNSVDGNTIVGNRRAVKVSFDRPYNGDGDGLFLKWEHYMVQWLEREGYNVTYSTNIDQHNNGGRLLNYKGFISSGHDEYWTKEIYDAVENARDAGVHLAFTGANVAYWQSRLEDNDRVLVVYKNRNVDPEPNDALKTIRFRDLDRAEQTLVGIQYRTYNDNSSNNTSYIVENSTHWIYANSGFRNGSSVPRIVGYEIDNIHNEYPGPPDDGTPQEILSNSPFLDHADTISNADSSIYQAGSGAWVFAAGTMSWPWALTRDGYKNSGIQQAMSNIFERFLDDGVQLSQSLALDNPGDQNNQVGETVTLQLAATAGNNDRLTFSAVGLPLVLELNSDTGEISGRLTAPTDTTVIVSVEDGNGDRASQSFNWTVVADNQSPTLVNPDDQSSQVGEAIRLQLSANDDDNDRLTFSAVGLPLALELDSATGEISGQLTAPTDTTVIVSVEDGNGGRASQSFRWTVFAGNRPPTLADPVNQSHQVGETVTLQLNARDDDNDTLTYSAVGLPLGLELDTATGEIRGQLTAPTVTTVIVGADDGNGGRAGQSFRWTVTGSTSPVIIQAGQAAIESNDTILLPVTVLPGDSNQSIGTISFDITYDDSVILVTDCDMADFIGACNTDTAGVVSVAGANADGAQSDTVIVEIEIQATGLGNLGSDLTIDVLSLTDVIGNPIANYETQNGEIILLDSAFGLGDVNCDGAVTSVDSLYIIQYVVNLRSNTGGCPLGDTQTELNSNLGDVNSSNATDSIDSLAILQCAVGITNGFCSADDSAADDIAAANIQPRQTFESEVAMLAILPHENSLSMQLNSADINVGTGTFELRYNAAQAKLLDCTAIAGGLCNEIEPGIVRISFINAVGITGNHVLVSLAFDSDEARITEIDVINLIDSAFRMVPYKTVLYKSATAEINNHSLNGSTHRLLIPFVNNR